MWRNVFAQRRIVLGGAIFLFLVILLLLTLRVQRSSPEIPLYSGKWNVFCECLFGTKEFETSLCSLPHQNLIMIGEDKHTHCITSAMRGQKSENSKKVGFGAILMLNPSDSLSRSSEREEENEYNRQFLAFGGSAYREKEVGDIVKASTFALLLSHPWDIILVSDSMKSYYREAKSIIRAVSRFHDPLNLIIKGCSRDDGNIALVQLGDYVFHQDSEFCAVMNTQLKDKEDVECDIVAAFGSSLRNGVLLNEVSLLDDDSSSWNLRTFKLFEEGEGVLPPETSLSIAKAASDQQLPVFHLDYEVSSSSFIQKFEGNWNKGLQLEIDSVESLSSIRFSEKCVVSENIKKGEVHGNTERLHVFASSNARISPYNISGTVETCSQQIPRAIAFSQDHLGSGSCPYDAVRLFSNMMVMSPLLQSRSDLKALLPALDAKSGDFVDFFVDLLSIDREQVVLMDKEDSCVQVDTLLLPTSAMNSLFSLSAVLAARSVLYSRFGWNVDSFSPGLSQGMVHTECCGCRRNVFFVSPTLQSDPLIEDLVRFIREKYSLESLSVIRSDKVVEAFIAARCSVNIFLLDDGGGAVSLFASPRSTTVVQFFRDGLTYDRSLVELAASLSLDYLGVRYDITAGNKLQLDDSILDELFRASK